MVRAKVLVPFYAWLVVFCLIIFQISYVNIRNYEIDDCIEYAKGINSLVIDAIDLDRVDEYLRIGRAAPGYNESEAQLNKLRNAYPDVVFLYVYQIKPDGCHVVFDLSTPDMPADEPGTVVEFDESFANVREDLYAGRPVDPVISNDHFGHLLTVYTPAYDSTGACVCYAAVDFSMGSIRSYVLSTVMHVALFALFFAVLSALLGYLYTSRHIFKPLQAVENIAYRDELTGVRNKTAFAQHKKQLDANIKAGTASFVLAMVDVNYLKRVNDNYGHEKGDEYLRTCVDAICKVFGHDRVYRIGGDEYVAVLEDEHEPEVRYLRERFKHDMTRMAEDPELPAWRKVSAAVGIAAYDPVRDESTDDVLKRADAAMYEEKKAMKAERRD